MASSSMVPGKITLHSTSKIPLSERFKMVQQTALIKKNIEPVVRPSRVSVKPLARGSWKNRQLAAALANKPSVRAALKIKKKSIKQRLSVKPKPTRGSVPGLVNRTFPSSRKSTKKSIIERLQVAPSTSGNARRPKLNRSNFVGLTKVAPKNVRRVSRRQGGNTASLNHNAVNRRPAANRFNNNNSNNKNTNNNNNKVNNNKQNSNQGNRPSRQGTANIAARRNQQRLNQHMKNRRLTPNNNNFNGNQQRPPQRQRQFNRRNNQQGKPGPQGARTRGFKQDQGNRNVNKRFQNRRPNNRQNQPRRNRNSLDKDLDAYMAKTRTQLDADLDAYMAAT